MQGPGGTCYFKDPTDRTNVTDIRLGPLGYHGGRTMTHRLLAGSAAIDGAQAEHCPETDQRGVDRPLDGDGDGVAACDVGAFEARWSITEVPALGGVGVGVLVLLMAGASFVLLGRRRGSYRGT